MPLVMMCGVPSSGKTLRAKRLREELESRGRSVKIISESAEMAACRLTKDACFADQNNEKQMRASLKAKVISLLDPNTTVILDSSNYIKGFRYELYCASKACKTTQCTIFTIINMAEASSFNRARMSITEEVFKDEKDLDKIALSIENSAYSEETFNALLLRFEEPNSQNRWDSPLFTVQPQDELNIDDIYASLYLKKPPPPNMSTQNPPLSSTNFLYELDKTILDISNTILDNKKINPHSEMRFPTYTSSVLEAECVQAIQPAMLHRLRRQFMTFAKMHYSNHDVNQIGGLYVQYLNGNLQNT